jgi:hypothetical protein
MSFGVFVGLVMMSALLGLGQWAFFKLFNHSKADYIPLFGSLLLTNLVLVLIRGMIK